MKADNFLNIIEATPLVSIDLIIENEKSEILLGKRNNRPAKDYWFVPGGRIRKNETLENAFKRISFAELGIELSIQNASLLGPYDHIYSDNFHGKEDINTHYVAIGFKVRMSSIEKFTLDTQHTEMVWWPKDELLQNDSVHQNTKNYLL